MTLAIVRGPDGEEWATAPDPSWRLREEFPPTGELVEMCWAGRRQRGNYGEFGYGRGRLCEWHHDGPYKMSTWENERGETLVFNPDFWRPV